MSRASQTSQGPSTGKSVVSQRRECYLPRVGVSPDTSTQDGRKKEADWRGEEREVRCVLHASAGGIMSLEKLGLWSSLGVI